MNKKAESGILSNFIMVLIAVTAVYIIYVSSIAAFNQGYGTSVDISGTGNYSSMSSVQNLTNDLTNQFTGANATTSSGGVLGDSFNQVYTLGIVTTRIVGTVTPGLFSNIIYTIGNTFGIDPSLVALGAFAITILLIGGLLLVLLGRLL